MFFRTDLAIESQGLSSHDIEGTLYKEETAGDLKITKIKIETDFAAQKIGKPIGTYITIETPPLTDYSKNSESNIEIIAEQIRSLIPKEGLVLIAGLGNQNITPDALGPKSTSMILATRHIQGEIARSAGLEALRPTSVISTGVLGQTGIETEEFILSIVKRLNPAAVIVIDALASSQLSRLGRTIQVSDTGISPGSGVGNSRPGINKESLNVPVISIGVPTVVDASTLTYDLLNLSNSEEDTAIKEKISPNGQKMIVTPREIDLLIERAAKLTAMAVNCALQPDFSPEDILSLVS